MLTTPTVSYEEDFAPKLVVQYGYLDEQGFLDGRTLDTMFVKGKLTKFDYRDNYKSWVVDGGGITMTTVPENEILSQANTKKDTDIGVTFPETPNELADWLDATKINVLYP